MIFGWVLFGIGALLSIWPHALVSLAHQYRMSMPAQSSTRSVAAARMGALAVAVVGLVIALTA